MSKEARKKNLEKAMSYAEAWRRIRDAQAAGFYFEVVTLCESIISDRLLSYIVGKHGKANERTNFHDLIKKWEVLAGDGVPVFESVPLPKAVDQWRKRRNEVVHGLVKSEPGKPTQRVGQFLACAEDAADIGRKLADEVSKWHKKQLRKHRKISKEDSA